ncbi:copper resistance protein CopC [Micromonospora sp. KC207]|uniref:copper resistance CopC family protein n=1 Tax=Micromonospora sp. KC207 TaxID=2530377 RepID=UPI00104BD10E|nr:copper resistance CopC family protein [Micromonospora sp. KC207]TDC63988.1 copper resistance protein CopC [Micromonospora sp. KC207]
MRSPVRRHRVVGPAVALTTLVALLAPAAPAAAHNSLTAATPAAEARLATPPSEISVRFLQKLDPELTTIVLSDAARRVVPTGVPVVTGSRATVTVAEPLPDGAYTVAYRIVSTDGHPVQGSYRFTVAGPAAATTPALAAPSTPIPTTGVAGAAAHPGRGGGPGPLAVAAGSVLVAAALVVVAALRRRRTR